MTVKIYTPMGQTPPRPRGYYRERYRFDDLQVGQCMELDNKTLDDPVRDVLDAYNAYAQYRGIKHSRQTTESGAFIWRFS